MFKAMTKNKIWVHSGNHRVSEDEPRDGDPFWTPYVRESEGSVGSAIKDEIQTQISAALRELHLRVWAEGNSVTVKLYRDTYGAETELLTGDTDMLTGDTDRS